MRRLLVIGVLLVGLLAIEPASVGAQLSPEAGGATDWRAVSVGFQHTCAIRAPGHLWCWGSDQFGQLGTGAGDGTTSVPVEVAGQFADWTNVATGGYHTCARRRSGRLYCWGYDFAGELGNGGANAVAQTPVEVVGGVTTWTSIAAGLYGTCAARSTGRLFCWGDDSGGRLGNGGDDLEADTPRLVAGGITDWAAVTMGSNHVCGRRRTGQVLCWGYDNVGQLGNGAPAANRAIPSSVAGGGTWTAVVAGGHHSCARRPSGRLFCWGYDANGQLGDGGTNTNRLAPREVSGGRTDWTQFGLGDGHTCARRAGGRIFCWGSDGAGQLGNGPTVTADQPTPTALSPDATDWVVLDGGGADSCARTQGNRLYCWGYDFLGQVGDGPPQPHAVDRASEVYVPA